MELVQFLMAVATRHERGKDDHEEEIKELNLRQKKNMSGRTSFTLTYDDELALLKGVIGSVRGKPPCLKKLTAPAIGVLAYILTAKVENDVFIEGHEIVTKLIYDQEQTIVYLKGFAELKEKGGMDQGHRQTWNVLHRSTAFQLAAGVVGVKRIL